MRRRFAPTPAVALLLLALHPVWADRARAANLAYPPTAKEGVADDYFGTTVADPYRWLEDADAKRTAEWVTAQNALTFSYLAGIPERAAIKERLTRLWDYDRYGIPFHKNDWYFYSRNDGLQNHAVYYKMRTLGDTPEVFIDPNAFSKDGTVALTNVEVSEDGRLAVYGKSVAGSDWREFFVREVATGRDLPDHIRHVKFSSVAWTLDGRGFFYSRFPEPKGNALTSVNQNQKIYYHAIGTAQAADRLIYERPDQPELGLYCGVTDDGRYAFISVTRGTERKNRLHLIDLGDPLAPRLDAPVVRLIDEPDASYQVVGNDGPIVYLQTDLDAPRGRVVAVDLGSPDRAAWRTIIPESEDALKGVSLVGERFVARYLHDASSRVRLYGLDGRADTEIALPTLGAVDGFKGLRSDTETFYSFTSFLHPITIYRYDFGTGKSEVLRAPSLPGYDASAYETEQVFFKSRDGTRVPMFLTHRRGMARDGANPTLLYGYGGFNVSMTPSFSPSTIAWIEMGGLYALPNLRGGGEYGAAWHAAGKKENRQNVFDDFIAAAEYLESEGYTAPSRLAIKGESNGGLLVGAVMTQRPELFGAALPGVGVLDMLRFHKFTIGWAWASDYGSSEDAGEFRTLLAYSPLHNLREGKCYPPTLVTTGDHDDRVVPAHSFKFAAALQERQACAHPTLIRVDVSTGHGAGKSTSRVIEESADRLSFLVKNLGMSGESSAGAGNGAGLAP